MNHYRLDNLVLLDNTSGSMRALEQLIHILRKNYFTFALYTQITVDISE